jgi:hypothetical protein
MASALCHDLNSRGRRNWAGSWDQARNPEVTHAGIGYAGPDPGSVIAAGAFRTTH